MFGHVNVSQQKLQNVKQTGNQSWERELTQPSQNSKETGQKEKVEKPIYTPLGVNGTKKPQILKMEIVESSSPEK